MLKTERAVTIEYQICHTNLSMLLGSDSPSCMDELSSGQIPTGWKAKYRVSAITLTATQMAMYATFCRLQIFIESKHSYALTRYFVFAK